MAKTYPTLGTVAPGDVLRANSGTAPYNNVVSSLNNQRVPPMCVLYNTSVPALATTSETTVAFPSGTEQVDTDDMHDNTTNNSRITINTAGIYIVTASVAMDISATGRRLISVFKNGSVIGLAAEIPASSASYPQITVSAPLSLVATDYITCAIFQDRGSNLNITSVRLSAMWIGQAS